MLKQAIESLIEDLKNSYYKNLEISDCKLTDESRYYNQGYYKATKKILDRLEIILGEKKGGDKYV